MSQEAAKLWFKDKPNSLRKVTIGNLNQTFMIENDEGRFVLQQLNPVFAPEVNLDIQALTTHLAKKGVGTTTLIPTLDGALWADLEGKSYRLLSFIEGDNFSSLSNAVQAKEAGHLVGMFHRAVSDFQHEYRFSRGNVHDTKSHLLKLKKALAQHSDHEMINEVLELAEPMLRASELLVDLSTLPKRHSHGDLKINNIIFGSDTENHSLIDLDTIGLMPWALEMGDAFRSWCNPAGENSERVSFNETFFEASLQAYADVAGDFWSRTERDYLIEGVRAIPLELASRFLRDVLEDSYFGYDATRFSSRKAHNLLRAKGQFALYCEIEKKKAQLEQMIVRAFA